MTEQAPESKSTGKGRATPSRKAAEAAKVRPLVGDRTPEGKALAKEKAKAERERIRAGQLAGDDRYLPFRDRGPQKRLARDIVDGRYSVGEFLIPVMVLVLILSLLDQGHPTSTYNQVLSVSTLGIMVLVIIDSAFIYRKVKRVTTEKFGDKAERGLALYAAMRGTQPRIARLPKAAVNPRDKK
ncbi:MAG: DUF3043 domain-containing protein [Micrococcales bacterium]